MAEGTENAIWFRSAKWYETNKGEFSEAATDRQACGYIGWGTVINRGNSDVAVEVKEYTNRKGVKSYMVKCVLAQYNRNYCTLISWGDNPVSRVMTTLEKDDRVFVAGKEITRPYTNKKQERIILTEVQVFMIIPMGHVEATQTMYMNDNLQMLLNGNMPELSESSNESDEFESAEYNEDEYDQEEEFDPGEDEFEEPDPMEVPWR